MHKKLLAKRKVPRHDFQEQPEMQRQTHSTENRLFKKSWEGGGGERKRVRERKRERKTLRESSLLQACYTPADQTLDLEATKKNHIFIIHFLDLCYTKGVTVVTIKLISQEIYVLN